MRMGASRSISLATVSRSARIARLRVRKKARRRGPRRLLECAAGPGGLRLLAGDARGLVRRVAPEPFQAVEAPGVLGEDVDDEIAVVEEDPPARRCALDQHRLDLLLLAQ